MYKNLYKKAFLSVRPHFTWFTICQHKYSINKNKTIYIEQSKRMKHYQALKVTSVGFYDILLFSYTQIGQTGIMGV